MFENVLVGSTFGPKGRLSVSKEEAAVGALQQAGMLDKANVVAGALTLLDRKRLELARALATQPTLLLLDEIAGGLTEGEVLELVDTIKRIRRRRCVDRVDRAHRACLAARRRPNGCGRRRAKADRGRSARSDGIQRGAAVYLGDDLADDSAPGAP